MSLQSVRPETVYAVRPFHATLAGHVDANVGDELVLINDTHWYWWLVRVQRTACIGYIPAEFVELLTERVARQNKDANTFIPMPMLQHMRKSKSPGSVPKTVRFAEACCYEPSFYDCLSSPPGLENDTSDTSDLSDECESPVSEENPMDHLHERMADTTTPRKENPIFQTGFDAIHKIDNKLNILIRGFK